MLFLVSRFVLGKKKSCQISGQNNIVDIFVSFLSWGKTSQTTKIGSFLKRFYENVQALFRTNLRILFEADKKQRNWSIIQRVFAKCVKIISQKKMAEHVYDFSSVHNRNNRCWFYAEKNGTHTESRLHTSPYLWWMKPSCEIFYLVNCLSWYLFGFFLHIHIVNSVSFRNCFYEPNVMKWKSIFTFNQLDEFLMNVEAFSRCIPSIMAD